MGRSLDVIVTRTAASHAAIDCLSGYGERLRSIDRWSLIEFVIGHNSVTAADLFVLSGKRLHVASFR